MNEKKNSEVKVRKIMEPIDADDVVNNEILRNENIDVSKYVEKPKNVGGSRYRKLPTLLGEGAFKRVYKALDEEEGKEVAWNEVLISNSDIPRKDKNSLSKEIGLLKNMSHPNILRIFDYWYVDNNFVFITELMTDGTLRDYIKGIGGNVSIKLIKKWSKQILEGLEYLHSQNPPIIHRDIKCDNIFINASVGEVKIGDLGIAKERRLKRYTLIGTPQFMAREMFEGDGYNEKIDIYAFGMCLIEMATGVHPYSEYDDSSEVYKAIIQGIPPVALYSVKEPCLKNLILSCLVSEKNRLSCKDALDHHFYSQDISCVGDCIPTETILVQPLVTPCNDIEISLINCDQSLCMFQLFFMSEAKYIKFGFDILKDDIDVLSKELIKEGLVDKLYEKCLPDIIKKGVEKIIEEGYLEKFNNEKNDNYSSEIKDKSAIRQSSVIRNIQKGNININFNDLGGRITNIEIGRQDDSLEKSTIDNKNEKENDAQLNVEKKDSALPCENTAAKVLSQESCDEGQKAIKTEYAKLDYPVEKYINNCSIEQFVSDTANIFNRTQEVADNWLKILKSHEIETVFDLKSLVYEDWDKLGLTVFSSRAMKNMLYGFDNQPIKEKGLIDNPEYKTYDNDTSISSFLEDVASVIGRKSRVDSWATKFLSQDIRTVGELKSLHQDDLDRLGLSVFSCRIIKNIIFKKGKYP